MRANLGQGIWATVMGAAMAGCAAAPSAPSASSQPGALSSEQPMHLSMANPVPSGQRADRQIALEDLDYIMQLDIYQLTVPANAISRDERFWRHVDEDHVDLAAHELLWNNGLRFGIGPNDEWDYFKRLMDHYGATARKGTTSPTKRGFVELPLTPNVDVEDIFYFNPAGKLSGRTFEKCDNSLAITFEPAPRQTGAAHIDACAVVRGLRKQYEITVLNDQRDIELRRPEYLYDLRLSQDIPLDHFLVIGPSPRSSIPYSLGNTLLVHVGGAAPTETILLLVPRPFRITGPAPSVQLRRPTDVAPAAAH